MNTRAALCASVAATEPDPFSPLRMVSVQLASLANYGRKYKSPDWCEAIADALRIVETVRGLTASNTIATGG